MVLKQEKRVKTANKGNTPEVCMFCVNKLGHSLVGPGSEAVALWNRRGGTEHGRGAERAVWMCEAGLGSV